MGYPLYMGTVLLTIAVLVLHLSGTCGIKSRISEWRTLLDIVISTRSECDTESLCNAEIIRTDSTNFDDRDYHHSYQYFARWYPPKELPRNSTSIQCSTGQEAAPANYSSRRLIDSLIPGEVAFIPHRCTFPEQAVCMIYKHGTAPYVYHFPHAAEVLLPCWHFFAQCAPDVRDKVISFDLESPTADLFMASSWMQEMLTSLQIRVVDELHRHDHDEHLRHQDVCQLIYDKPHTRNRGPQRSYVQWSMNPPLVRSIKDFVLSSAPPQTSEEPVVDADFRSDHDNFRDDGEEIEYEEAISIGVLDRKSSRRFSNAEELLQSIRSFRYNLYSFNVSHQIMDGLSLTRQASWVHQQNIILATHGAQNTNLVFIKPCTVVIECYPLRYFLPNYFLPLVDDAGGIPFVLIPLPEEHSDPMEMTRNQTTMADRIKAREMQVTVDVETVLLKRVLPVAVKAFTRCMNHIN